MKTINARNLMGDRDIHSAYDEATGRLSDATARMDAATDALFAAQEAHAYAQSQLFAASAEWALAYKRVGVAAGITRDTARRPRPATVAAQYSNSAQEARASAQEARAKKLAYDFPDAYPDAYATDEATTATDNGPWSWPSEATGEWSPRN